VYACEMKSISLELGEKGGGLTEDEKACMTEYTLDIKTGAATSRKLTSVHADFPVINPTLLSKPCRYAFCATMDDDVRTPNFDGIAKFDLTTKDGTDALVGRITYPPGVLGGEAVYVPRVQTGAPTPEGEDDGYMLVHQHNTSTDVSSLAVYDARTMDSTPLATVRMPQRVPYGFHGLYITAEQLKKQSNTL
jgi:carotenoid cleavage dioxygenase-like enzyme